MVAIHSEGAVGVLSARATVVAISVCAVFAGVGAGLPRGLKREAEYQAHDQLQLVVHEGKARGERHHESRRGGHGVRGARELQSVNSAGLVII